MEPWVSEGDVRMQTAASVGMVLVGGVLMWGFRGFAAQGTNALAGFLLGVLLGGIGVAGLVVTGRQRVTIDPRTRLIVVEDATVLLGTRRRVIPFAQVESAGVGYVGRKSSGVRSYYVVLRLRDGEEYPLFAPGRFFPGAGDRGVVAGWATRLEGLLADARATRPSGVAGDPPA